MQPNRARRVLIVAATGLATTALAGAAAAAAPGRPAPARNVFAVYASPYHDTVEPSIGVDRRTGTALFTSGGGTRVVRFDDRVSPPRATFSTSTALSTAPTSLDPIGFVDPWTGRAFDSELAGVCSFTTFSDDDGKTGQTSQGCGENTLLDHQTLGGGPYHKGSPVGPLASYPNAVYYCAQDGATSTCARSDDGGQTFGPGVEIGILAGRCSSLTGHVKVAPDGTVAVANKDCNGNPSREQLTDGFFDGGSPGANISEDNGLTWTARWVPGGTSQDEDDDSVAWSTHNRLWVAWQDGRNRSGALGALTSAAKVAYSDDHGKTFSTPVDISTPLGLHNIHFPEIVAGDDDRVAVQFLGTTATGDDQQMPFRGAWHQYMAMSYDAGKHWQTVDLTPKDPIMRGCVDLQGTKPGASNNPPVGSTICTQRDLYDFQDLSLDAQGRPVGVFVDACTAKCATTANAAPNDGQGMVVRLASGKGLYKKYDALLAHPHRHAAATAPASTGQSGWSGPTVDVAAALATASAGAPLSTYAGLAGLAALCAVAAVGLRPRGLTRPAR